MIDAWHDKVLRNDSFHHSAHKREEDKKMIYIILAFWSATKRNTCTALSKCGYFLFIS